MGKAKKTKKDLPNEKEILEKLDSLACALPSLVEKSYKDFNFFAAVGVTTQEIRHSHFLAGLFDINGKHGVGNIFLKAFLEELIDNPKKDHDLPMICANKDILLKTFHNKNRYYDLANEKKISVKTERVAEDSSRSDIVIKFENKKTIIIIENKISSVLHSNQLEKYQNEFSKNEYSQWKKIYVYLTPEGSNPIEMINGKDIYYRDWCVCSYENIKTILEKMLSMKKLTPKSSRKLKYILGDYVEMIKTNILSENAKVLAACKRIYNEHRDAIELLLQYSDNTEEIMNYCKDYLYKKGFLNILPNTWGNSQLYFLSENIINKLEQLGVRKPTKVNEIKFCYRIALENIDIGFKKIIYFQKDHNTKWELWQTKFCQDILNKKFPRNSDRYSAIRETIVESNIIFGNGAFDDSAKIDLNNKLDEFIDEIHEFENKAKNLVI